MLTEDKIKEIFFIADEFYKFIAECWENMAITTHSSDGVQKWITDNSSRIIALMTRQIGYRYIILSINIDDG